MKYIYRWNGEYFGFISKGNFFDASSKWVGWVEGKQVWLANGELLGEIRDNNYILRRTALIHSIPRIPNIPPISPVPPVPPVNRIGKVPLTGFKDALDKLKYGRI